jgi:hypothetical protein
VQLCNLVRSFAGLREEEPVFFFPKRGISLLFQKEILMSIDVLSEPFIVLSPDLSGKYSEGGARVINTEGGKQLCSDCAEHGDHLRISEDGETFGIDYPRFIEILPRTEFAVCEACNRLIEGSADVL